ncbi:hypothetical protein M3226_05235 [Neobacillus cucumis]|uniref:hypothetical protein n=1 Tax=Neobacillus cucumis TaxID=1740721 RepID=UPI002040C304|nr:hypothetical protein [Neobacillus cucumis]MCM3725101.1 hypothetical protein [Neobacillus cucumis]
MEYSQITDEMIEVHLLAHLEKLVGSLGSFIGVVKGKIDDPKGYDKKTLHDIFNSLVVMEIEAIEFRNDLQEKKAVTFPAVLKAELKKINLKDGLYV